MIYQESISEIGFIIDFVSGLLGDFRPRRGHPPSCTGLREDGFWCERTQMGLYLYPELTISPILEEGHK